MFKQREAIIRLLKDEDPETVHLTKKQLAEGGTETIPDLRDLLSTGDKQLAFHIQEILSEIETRYAKIAFEEICQKISDPVDLEWACWYLAQIFIPGIDVEPYQKTIDSWGRELRGRLSGHDSDTSRVVAMAEFFGTDLGFRGNADDYYNARNSLLPCVIDSRLGIPISLSVLYMIVARRAAIAVDGINLPGHFVVRHGAVLFDPFDGGRILATRDCAEILSKQSLTLHPTHLQIAHPKLILVRMLSNLLYVFELEDDEALYGMVTRWIHLLDPK